MRRILILIADLLILIGVLGALVGFSGKTDLMLNRMDEVGLGGIAGPTRSALAGLTILEQRLFPGWLGSTAESPAESAVVIEAPAPPPSSRVYPAITGLRIPRIDLESEVVPSPLVELSQGVTWSVPPFKVGHAEGTARAGQPGNAVLVGHVTSLTLGNVFLHLDRLKVGDFVYVRDDEDEELRYIVDKVEVVPRSALDVVQPTRFPALTMLTCTGDWLPDERDYSERVVVRARLTR